MTLSLLAAAVALASYAFLPVVVFAQNDGQGPTWNDKHYEKHHWDKDSKSYKDDSGHEYKCETFHEGSYYYFYNGNFWNCDDYTPSSPSQTPY